MLNLKSGDAIIICERNKERTCTVEKITPGGNIKVDGMLFNGKTGRIKSSDPYATAYIKLGGNHE